MAGNVSHGGARLEPRAAHPLIGRIIAERFQIASFIGDGRIAQVFCAQQLDETRHVALKVVLPAFTGDQDVVGRFLFAAEKCRRLRHDNIVPMHAAGEDRDVLYLATDLVVGETLRSAIDARGPMLEAESIRIVSAVADALEHALGLGVLHRGLRPTNVLLTRRPEAPELEVVKVCDFGMGDVVEALRARDPYASPERVRGEPSTPGADVYALGAMLFELLTGRGFRREKPQDAIMAIKRERQHHAQRPAPIRPATLRLLERALEIDPRERHPSVRELRAELATTQQPPSAAPAPKRSTRPPPSAPRASSADTVPGHVVSAGGERSLIGRTLDGAFRVVSYMRSGGMAHLYYGTRVDQSERIVIKLLHPRLCEEPDIIERFAREARIAAQLVHPNIVEILHVGDQYFVMELVAGDDLARRVRQRGRLPEAQAAQIGIEVSRALAYAHSRRVVHRDIKPANIMIHADDNGIEQVKLLDFGIAKLLDNTKDRVVSADLTRNRSALTSVGDLIGTPRYMSPEQGRAEGIDRRSDLYSLGVVLYELLTGFVPFDGETALQIVARHVQDEPRPPRDLAPDVSPELERLVLQLLAKDPAARPASANEVESRLTAMLPELGHARSTSTRRWLSRDIDAAAVDWDAQASRIYIPSDAAAAALSKAADPASTPAPGSTTEPASAPSAVTGEHDRMVSLRCLADGVADKLDDALAAILGFSSLISDALRLGDPLLDDVGQINRAAERAAAMRDQLLAFTGRQPMSPWRGTG